MIKPRAFILAGYGINCEEETACAFKISGADADIVHINDLIENKKMLDNYNIFVIPGGFSYGDDTGSGLALANRIKNNMLDELVRFIGRDTLMLGICNGFQVMVNLGIVPGLFNNSPLNRGRNTEGKFTGRAEVALEHNNTHRYQCRWVDLMIERDSRSVFTAGVEFLHIPVAHGEGNFFAPPEIISAMEEKRLVAMRYIDDNGKPANGKFPFNPNGSMNDIAAITDETGRIMGMMPHPERGIFFSQRDDWPYLMEKMEREGAAVPFESDGLIIFKNAVKYFL